MTLVIGRFLAIAVALGMAAPAAVRQMPSDAGVPLTADAGIAAALGRIAAHSGLWRDANVASRS